MKVYFTIVKYYCETDGIVRSKWNYLDEEQKSNNKELLELTVIIPNSNFI